METRELNPNLQYKPWCQKIDQVSHLTIETNMTCNMRCKSCYNKNKHYVKSLEQIKEEVDLGLEKRNADLVSILGGEPTLHPDIDKVIKYIKSKKVVCQLLTNGLLLLDDKSDKLIDKLVNSGLDRFIIHIDKGQDVHEDTSESMHKLIKKLEKRKVMVFLSWTIYDKSKAYLPSLIKEFSKYKNFDGILSVLSKDMNKTILPNYVKNGSPKMIDEYRSLKENLGLEPSLYLPSNLSVNHIKWFIYMYYINKRTFETFYLSPRFTGIFQGSGMKKLSKLFLKHNSINMFMLCAFLIVGILELIMRPGRINKYFKVLKKSNFLRDIRFHSVTVQDPPEFDPKYGKISMCYHCPDATIRNGKITPVCMADRINPLPGSKLPDDTSDKLPETVYEHLCEC